MHVRILTGVLFFLLSSAASDAQVVVNDSAAIVAVVQQFHAAMAAGDAAAINRMIAEDVAIHEAGNVEGRAQYVANHLPADLEFEKTVSIKRSGIRAVVMGDAAWVTSTSEMQGTFNGRTVDSIGTELIVLSRVADSWRIRAISWTGRARQPAK
jgi:ketosteroid isomerase-like protein